MRTFFKMLGFIAVLTFVLLPGQVLRAQNSVSFQTFYDQLSGEGTWIQTNDYGYVFQPNVSDSNWRPYTRGHWVHTDDGMMWASDEPFGWATYHYGRWVNLADEGWVWVPGYTWAPSWVSWRESDDYYGWAPLPPETAVGVDFAVGDVGFGFHIGDDCDVAYDIGPEYYNFCPVAYIGDPYAWRYYRSPFDNFAIIGGTRNITNINIVNNNFSGGSFSQFGRVNSGGPALATLNARSRTPITTASLTSASKLAQNGQKNGNSLAVFAPTVDPRTVKAAKPQSVSRTLAATNVNRGTSINNPLAVNSHLRGATPTSTQVQAATQAQSNLAAGAKVATANTRPTKTLTQPLTSLRANTGVNANAGAGANAGMNKKSATMAGSNLKPNASVSANAGAGANAGMNKKSATMAGSNLKPNASVSANAAQSATIKPAHTHAASSISASNTASVNRHRESTSSSASVNSSFNAGGGSPSGGSVHQAARVMHESSAPAFHPSAAPSFHPQPSVHEAAPAAHFGGGAPAAHISGGSPAAHVSGGAGGGGQHAAVKSDGGDKKHP